MPDTHRGARREYFAYAAIFGFGIIAGAAIHCNAAASLAAAKLRYRAESHAASLAAQNIVQTQLNDIYQNIRTISRLPSVRKIDRYAKNIDPDGIDTIHQLYDNLASTVDVSEVYIVPRTLDADQIDPVTGAPQTPILMFDDEVADDRKDSDVTKRFEAEIYEYHLLHQQMLWFAGHTPNIKAVNGINLPMISGHQVITCDNTVYNTSLKNMDRTGMIFSVPFFDISGVFQGSVSAIIRIKAIRALLPRQYYALVNPAANLLMLSPQGGITPHDLSLAAQARTDPSLIYNEDLTLYVNDPSTSWSLWASLPNSDFYTRPDVRAVHTFALSAYGVLGLLMLIALTAVRMVAANNRRIAGAACALDVLASGDVTATLNIDAQSGPINDLSRAFTKFRDSLHEKQLLEQRAAADARHAETERQHFDAERTQSIADQKQVVDSLAAALISFASGDLTFKINQAFSDDYKTLQHDFNQASAKMESTMLRVMTSTGNVETGARDIQTATAELASQTASQAARLEQTAAALNELTSTVQQTSQNAGNAAGLADAARSDATASSTVVSDTLAAMNGIETSSKQIANIIGVIDEIAFQTNLLALNAGVEAARAGDAGRGFAVVATEVRALAQRSAKAAKEIKTIIATASAQVGNGVARVNETGQALLRITGQISQLTDLVRDIAAAAKQQATSLQQLNQAVAQMDRDTQQNARMVEQAASACGSLTQGASGLHVLIGEFKLSDTMKTQPLPLAALSARRFLQAVK